MKEIKSKNYRSLMYDSASFYDKPLEKVALTLDNAYWESSFRKHAKKCIRHLREMYDIIGYSNSDGCCAEEKKQIQDTIDAVDNMSQKFKLPSNEELYKSWKAKNPDKNTEQRTYYGLNPLTWFKKR